MIEHKSSNSKNFIVGFHTQEWRPDNELDFPIKANPKNAWLGVGYYFWAEEEFATLNAKIIIDL